MNTILTKETGQRFVDEGEGEPIILLYGLFGSVKNFNALINHLRQTHRVIVPVFPFYEMGISVDIFSLTEFSA